jgi:cell division septum initiation protein DivIVA
MTEKPIETLGKRLVTHVSLSQSLLNDNEQLRAEIDQLREAIRRLADQDATLSVQGGSVTVTLDTTLTDEEREAIETAMDGYIAWMDDNVALETPRVQAKLATLRKLLERLHT